MAASGTALSLVLASGVHARAAPRALTSPGSKLVPSWLSERWKYAYSPKKPLSTAEGSWSDAS
jgi:hypothetical protein